MLSISTLRLRSLAQYQVEGWVSISLHSVSVATNPEGERCFLKRLQAVASEEKKKRQFFTSVAAVRSLTHDSVLRLTGYFVENNDYILESPYCAGGTLKEWLSAGARTAEQKLAVADRLVSTLSYMHSNGKRFDRCDLNFIASAAMVCE